MERKDYYAILGVSPDATEDEIKKKYRSEALKWHPDRWATASDEEKKTAEDKFKELSEAYQVLSDPEKRERYDNHQDPNMGGGPDIDPMEVFREMQRHFGFGGGGFPGFGFGNNTPRGEDVHAEVELTLKEAYEGGEREIKIFRNSECPHCHGTGDDDGKPTICPDCHGKGMVGQMVQNGPGQMSFFSHPCGRCHGTGRIINNPCHECGGTGIKKDIETRKMNLPRGLGNGMSLTIRGGGQQIPNGEPGNLIIHVIVEEDPYFVRPDMRNVVHYEEVPFTEALLGFKKKFRCVDGSEVELEVPELTPHGKAFYFRGKGMPDPNSGQFGDYAVVINHKLPEKLTEEQRVFLKQLNERINF